ncbi:DUF456 domain-containing protein [Chishuiella sp.]|uniref:DUF456 domain-containing protein n=1 Tax=Chishuiella sp. TaxID=1969467 RepID=UPI0028A64A01|nr:DUF456 domain-containing protein [Chishuiella sp.]
MDQNTLLNILSGFLLILGLIGTILPVLPGSLLSFIGLVVFKFSNDSNYSWIALLVALFFVILGILFDYLLPIYMTKKLGGTKYGIWGSILGLIIGFFFPPFGFIVAPFLGAFIAELLFTKIKSVSALKSALGSFLGFILTTGYDVILSLIFITIFIYQLLN